MNLLYRIRLSLTTPTISSISRVNTYTSNTNIETIIKEDEQSKTEIQEDDKDDLPYKYGKNISGISPYHRRRLQGNYKIYDEAKHRIHYTVSYNRKILARDGLATGIDPAICWPGREEIEEAKEKLRLTENESIKDMIEKIKARKAKEKEDIIKREKQIEENFAKLGKWKEELANRIQKKFDDARKAKEKKEKLVEEVRRHFGFKMDPKDERFQQMLEQKEKQQKKEEKLAKRAAKEAALIAKLQQMSANVSSENQ